MTAIKTQDDRITFSVHDVAKSSHLLNTVKTRDAITALLSTTSECSPSNFQPVLACSGYNSNSLANVNCHPLFSAIHYSFSLHLPLVLSPDMIWVAIVQGLAQHIKNNSESLRKKIVEHEGKKELCILRDGPMLDSPEFDWEGVIEEFSSLLSANLPGKYDSLVSSFSTTGKIERIVCQIALMDAFQPYFEYVMKCICGIPSITLEGRPSDWQELQQKVEQLAYYELDWWLKDLRVILSHFERASRGDVDLSFWQNIYKQTRVYGGEIINGWILRLVPYLKCYNSGNFSVVNPELGTEFQKLSLEPPAKERFMHERVPGVSSGSLPSGLSMVPLKIADRDGVEKQTMQILGGFVGVEQDSSTMSIRPKLGWAVMRGAERDQMLDKMPPSCRIKPALAPAAFDAAIGKLTQERFYVHIPDDLFAFFKQCDGFELSKIRFLSLGELSFVVAPKLVAESDSLSADIAAVHGESNPTLWDKTRETLNKDLLKKPDDDSGEVQLRSSSWLRIAELEDRTFLAIELRSSAAGRLEEELGFSVSARASKPGGSTYLFKVARVRPDSGHGHLIATSFADLMELVKSTQGR